jgi:hypothetical protein
MNHYLGKQNDDVAPWVYSYAPEASISEEW